MAEVIQTLKSTGGDFVSWVTWEAQQIDLVTAQDNYILECYEGTTVNDNWVADGSLFEEFLTYDWPANETYYATIRAGAGQKYDPITDTGFRAVSNITSNPALIQVNTPTKLVLEDIGLAALNSSTGAGKALNVTNTGSDSGYPQILVYRCCIRGESQTGGYFFNIARRTGFIIEDSIVKSLENTNTSTAIRYDQRTNDPCIIRGCSVYGGTCIGLGASATSDAEIIGNTFTTKIGSGDPVYTGILTNLIGVVRDNAISDADGTNFPGTATYNVTAAAGVDMTNAPALDFTPIPSGKLDNTGGVPATATDFLKVVRSDPAEAGAYEIGGAAPTLIEEMYVKDGGIWVKYKPYIKDTGAWVETKAYVKEGGAWVQVYGEP